MLPVGNMGMGGMGNMGNMGNMMGSAGMGGTGGTVMHPAITMGSAPAGDPSALAAAQSAVQGVVDAQVAQQNAARARDGLPPLPAAGAP